MGAKSSKSTLDAQYTGSKDFEIEYGDGENPTAAKHNAHDHLAMRKIPEKSFPENIYGAAMVHLVHSIAQMEDTQVHVMTFAIFMLLGFNLFAQMFILYNVRMFLSWPAIMAIREIYADFHNEVHLEGKFSSAKFDAWGAQKKHDLCKIPLTEPFFFGVILCIWTMSCWAALRDLVVEFSLWYNLPPLPRDVVGGYVMFEKATDDAMADIYITRVHWSLKASVYAMLLLPQAAIVLYLWWLGAQWLTATPSFEDIVLNVVALEFILQLDEIMFRAFLPEPAQAMTKMYCVKRVDQHDHERTASQVLRQRLIAIFLAFVAVFGLPCLYLNHQQVLPDFKWDVEEPCTYYDSLLKNQSSLIGTTSRRLFGRRLLGRHFLEM